MERVIEAQDDSQLAEAIVALQRGEHVTVVLHGVPCATLEPIKHHRRLGIFAGMASPNPPERVFEPLSEEDLDAWEAAAAAAPNPGDQ